MIHLLEAYGELSGHLKSPTSADASNYCPEINPEPSGTKLSVKIEWLSKIVRIILLLKYNV